MRSGLARRLLIVTTAEIAVLASVLIVAAALFAFGSYVGSIRADLVATSGQLRASLESSPASRDGRAAAQLAAGRFLRSDLVVIVFDRDRRYDVYREHRGDPMPVVALARRSEPLPGSARSGPLASPIVGLATAFGLHTVRAHVGAVDVFVRESEASLVAATEGYFLPIALAIGIAVFVAYVLARALTVQALRPLEDVTEALERFAAGDLTPQPIAADRRHQLGRLAVAYNGAIDQMQRAFAERERANAAMRQFVADAGHQLRTPLTVVRGFIAILRKGDLRSPEDRDRILETMNRQSQVMGSLIEKLMLLERWADAPNATPPEPIDVAQLVEDVVAPMAEAQPGRVLRVDVPPGGLVAIDPSDLTYALTNLVDNALKYTHGAVDVRVRRAEGTIAIAIADEGPGMSPEEARHAFDRFFRGTRRDVDGSGLGLAIARRAVERAGGTLSLASDPRAGSVFTIVLPERTAAAPGALVEA